MANENESKEIDNAQIDGGIIKASMSAGGMKYESKDNEIETTEYCWKVNRAGLYRSLTNQINEKLNQAIQGLEYEGMIGPVVLYFACHTLAKHFAKQLELHGWSITLDPDDDVIQIDVVKSIDQMNKSNDDDDDIGNDGFFDDTLLSLK